MRGVAKLLFCLVGVGLLASSCASVRDEAGSAYPVLAEMADRYCIGPDGDHRLTWHLAEQDGFTSLVATTPGERQIPGVHNDSIRVFVQNHADVEIRVTTAATFLQSAEQGTTFFRWCWVSSSAGNLGDTIRDLRSQLSMRGFRVEKVRMFAWIPRPNGIVEPVSRRVFMREGYQLAREQGLRHVTVRAHEDGVFIGYATPRDEATYREFDWAGPEPVPAPE